MDVRRHEWGNTKGRGTVVKMEVTDTSGDIQISTFDGADELFARVKKGNVIQIPLAGTQIENKNDKWNKTTHRFEITLRAVASRGVRVLDDDDKLPRHNLQFTPIANLPSLPVDTNVHVLGVVVDAEAVEHGLTKSGTEGSQRTLTIADESLRSIPLRVSSSRVEHLGGSVGSIVVVKGQTGAYFGAPKLRAFAENVDIDPDIAEAQELRTHWQHVRREDVHPCLPILKFTPIASLATEADAKSEVDLLVIVVSAEPPISFVSSGGKAQRRVNMVVCDASGGDALPFTCFCPAEGALPALAPGVLLAIGSARVESYRGERKVSASLGRCTLEPHVPEAAALRAWWATREGDYAPNVPLPSLVAIDAVPSLAKGTPVRVVALS